MNWFLQRLSEPSTGAAIGLLATIAKTIPALAPYSEALTVVQGLAATHAFVMPEAASK